MPRMIACFDYVSLVSFNARLSTSIFMEQTLKASLYTSFTTAIYEQVSLRALIVLCSCINDFLLLWIIYRESFFQTLRYVGSLQIDEKFLFFEVFTTSIYFFIMFFFKIIVHSHIVKQKRNIFFIFLLNKVNIFFMNDHKEHIVSLIMQYCYTEHIECVVKNVQVCAYWNDEKNTLFLTDQY
jgi:hypothetical protein